MEAYEKLELEFGNWEGCNSPYTVACSSGTAALHLALETLSITEGWFAYRGRPNEVSITVPDYTMVACARAVSLADLPLRTVDVDDWGLLTPDTVKDIDNTAVMSVHLYGRKCCYSDARSVFDERTIIHDLAEGHGIRVRPWEVACWSFYKNKIIAGEEGGMVAFRNEEEAALAKKLRNLGFDDQHNFQHLPRGMNYRMSNCHAELVLESLRKYDENVEVRRGLEKAYDTLCPEDWRLSKRDVPWVYDMELPVHVDPVVRGLRAQGIPARHTFYPISQQREYRALNQGPHPTANRLARTRMYLPIYPDLEIPMMKDWMDAVERAVGVTGAPA